MAVTGGKRAIEDLQMTPRLVYEVARRAAELQMLPANTYDGLPEGRRMSMERGALYVMAAMETLGWTLFPPDPDGRPALPHAAPALIDPSTGRKF